MLLAVAFIYFLKYASAACFLRKVNNTEVCTCNSTHCDIIPEIGKLSKHDLKVYTTSRSVPGFSVHVENFGNVVTNTTIKVTLDINSKIKYQTIFGFGGAFTDATGQNIRRLPKKAQEKLLESYFGKNGIEYNLCRVPIGGTDFSPRAYSLDDHDGDVSLKHFALQKEDFIYKIPFIEDALNMTEGNLKLFASAWTAPPWMKDHYLWTGYSMLKNDSFQLWADYTVKFFDEYKKRGIKFWGLTTGNEPSNGFYSHQYRTINSMGWIPQLQVKWLSEHMGPTLKTSSHKNVKIMIHDDGALTFPYFVPLMLSDDKALKYIDGIATHWYSDDQTSFEIRDLAKTNKKDVFFLATEACYFVTNPYIGDWGRASELADNIINYLAYGYVGWVDWNMVLNYTGGFTYIDYLADAPIIISQDSTEFYKQPMFYVLGHFSKFIVPGSVRLKASLTGHGLKAVAFIRPDKLKAIVILNESRENIPMKLNDVDREPVVVNIPGKSLQTILYQAE